MSEYNNPQQMYYAAQGSLKSYIAKVFAHMGLALLVTAAISFFGCYSFVNGGIFYAVLSRASWLLYVVPVAELAIAFAMGFGITRFSPAVCTLLFYLYAVLTGLTFSVLPLVYGLGTVFTAFLFAAVLFVSCAAIGYTTNVDMTKFSGLLMGGLLALVLMTVISMFVPALRESLFIGYFGLILFLGITAWDTQKIKHFYMGTSDGMIRDNLAVHSAFQLYLDFINIFLYVLRILARSRSRD